MAIQIQLRRGNTNQNDLFTGAPGEVTFDTVNQNFRVHDGTTLGGYVIDQAKDVVHKTGNKTETVDGAKTFTGTVKLQNANTELKAKVLRLPYTSNTAQIEFQNIPINDGTLYYSDITFNDTGSKRISGIRGTHDANNNRGINIYACTADGTNCGGLTVSLPKDATSSTKPTISLNGPTGIGGNVTVNGTSNLKGNTTVTGTTALNGATTVTGNLTVNSGTVSCDTFTGNTFTGTANRAKWADLAENYVTDDRYSIGTLIKFGGKYDITIADDNCNGVISDKPGYLLDGALDDSLPVALVGKTPVRVIGLVNKFDRLTLSEIPGVAKVKTSENEKTIAIALESSVLQEEKLIKSVVKVNLD